MNQRSYYLLVCVGLMLLLIVGCSGTAPTPSPASILPPAATFPLPNATPVPSLAATPVPSPTATRVPSPTATPVPSPTATLILPLAIGAPLPHLGNIISSDNANNMVEIARWRGHTNRVSSIAFSPDGKILASASLDKTAKLWDMASGKEIRTLSGHTDAVYAVAFSPDGKILASMSLDKTVKLWDIASGHELHTLSGHTDIVNGVAFSPDGKTLVTASADSTIKLWDVASGQELRTFNAIHKGDLHTYGVLKIIYSPDGKLLASVSEWISSSTSNFYYQVDLWDVTSGKQVRTWGNDYLWAVAFSPDSKVLAFGMGPDAVLFDSASGREIHTFSGHKDKVHNVGFSPDGKTLITGSDDATIKLWDVASGKELRTLVNGEIWGVYWMATSPDGRTLASAYVDGTVSLFDVASGSEIYTITGNGYTDPLWSIAFSPDGMFFASAWGDGTIRLWGVYPSPTATPVLSPTATPVTSPTATLILPLANGTPLPHPANLISSDNVNNIVEIARWVGHTDLVIGIAFSPDSKILASASVDKTVKLWDVASRKELRTLSGHTDIVNDVAFSPDDKTVVTASADNTIKLWDVASGHELRTLISTLKDDSKNTRGVSKIIFSPDGKLLASVSYSTSSDNSSYFFYADLWDVASGKQVHTWGKDYIGCVAFSPDSKMLVLGIGSDAVLFDSASGSEIRTFRGHKDNVRTVGFTPDGKTLITGSSDATFKLWDVAKGNELRTLATSETQGVYAMTISPDGRILVSAYGNGRVRLWDVASGSQLRAINGNGVKNPILSVAFSPDGKYLASAWNDSTIRLWGVYP